MVSWGICAACLAAVNNFASLFIVRCLLGVMEAGLFPGVLFYLSFWYRKHELARRMSWFFAAASGAGAFGGVLAFGIAQMGGVLGLKGWQWVFLIEGIPTALFGIATWFVLPDFPSTAKFLTEDERKLATARLKLDHVDADEKEFSWPQFKATVTDIKVWGWMFAYIGVLVPLYSLSFFIPSINKSLGFTSLQAQAMSSPPFLAACVASIGAGFSSDYFKDRSSHVMTGAAVSSIGFFLLSVVRSAPALYALTIISAMGTFMMVPCILSWVICVNQVSNNMNGSTRGATAMAMVVGFGNIGGVIAGQVYRSTDAPTYQLGHTINGGFAAWAFVWALIVRLHLANLNKKRAAAESTAPTKSEDGNLLIGDEDPKFRYQL
ncbi:hypothetical protein HK096_004026 [Nowakowskiella sp. JEL0078]|nr:hypothetical protein HK096_004026 [Nowakowskiella sp. JEL0078]